MRGFRYPTESFIIPDRQSYTKTRARETWVRVPPRSHQNVRGLQVPMNDGFLVRVPVANLDLGWSGGAGWMATDDDLKSLHGDPALVAYAKEKAATAQKPK